MQLLNESPFSPFVFESLDAADNPAHVVFCRGTFEIRPDEILTPALEQESVVLADKYHQQPLTSSVRVDTDLVPFKHAADITLNSVACSPGSRLLEQWPVSVRVGSISKSLRVTGPRHWCYSLFRGWHLSSPSPVAQVPLKYEFAFGGNYQQDDQPMTFEQNPVGRGFGSPSYASKGEIILAPQVENPNERLTEFGRNFAPAGFGPVPKHWLPRRTLCGTADDHWKETRWPMRPRDFDFRYYNSAPEGLVYPGYLQGDEEILLTGLAPDGPISFGLPGISLTLFALTRANEIVLESMKLDTLHIDTTTMQAFLTWRLMFPRTTSLQTVQIVPERLDAAVTIS